MQPQEKARTSEINVLTQALLVSWRPMSKVNPPCQELHQSILLCLESPNLTQLPSEESGRGRRLPCPKNTTTLYLLGQQNGGHKLSVWRVVILLLKLDSPCNQRILNLSQIDRCFIQKYFENRLQATQRSCHQMPKLSHPLPQKYVKLWWRRYLLGAKNGRFQSLLLWFD